MSLRLLHLSDLHFGALDPAAASALVEHAARIAPGCAAVIVSGDLTQRARPWQFREARRWLDRLAERLGSPWYAVPGNHDVPLYAFWERFMCPLRRYGREIGLEAYELTLPGLRVVGVNTARAFVPVLNGFWKDGRITPAALEPLTSWPRPLAGELRILVAHHPFAAPPWARSADGVALGVDRVLPLLRSAGVHLVLGGHLHVQYAVRLADTADGVGLWSVQAATATSHRRRHLPGGREHPCGLNVIGVSDRGEVSVTGWEWGATEGWRGGEVRILGCFGGFGGGSV